jgi:hypothetical protein
VSLVKHKYGPTQKKSLFVCSMARYAKMEYLIFGVDLSSNLSNPSDLRCAVCSVLRAVCCVLCAVCWCVLDKLCNGDWFPAAACGLWGVLTQHSALTSIRNSKIVVITLSLFSIAFIYCQVFNKLSLRRLISFSLWKRL